MYKLQIHGKTIVLSILQLNLKIQKLTSISKISSSEINDLTRVKQSFMVKAKYMVGTLTIVNNNYT